MGFRLVYLALSAVLMIGVCGCMKNEPTIDKMVEYMNSKYSDHFEYSTPFGGGPGAISTQIIVKSEEYPDAKVWVEHYKQDDKDYFADNYVDYKYEQQTREILQKLLEGIYKCDVKLNFNIGTKGTRNSFTADTTFDEYIANPNSRIGFRAFVSNEYGQINKERVEEEMRSAITNTNIIIFGSIYFANEASQYESAFDLSFKVLDTLTSLQFDMESLGSFARFEWEGRP
jgi:hypothetical protein